MREKDQKLIPADLFPRESDITFELLGAAIQKFAYATCNHSRPKWKIKLKKMGENSYLWVS